jgi:8-oxo-dGTP pyrophosphatase MutT (NUDIX family)
MILSAVALIIRENRILLTKRSNYTKMFPHYWTLPGWKWDKNETPEDVVIREIKEELWVDFQIGKLFFHENIEFNWEPWSVNRFIGDYKWKLSMQEEEIDWYAWYTFEETKDLKIAFNHTEVIKRAYEEWYL